MHASMLFVYVCYVECRYSKIKQYQSTFKTFAEAEHWVNANSAQFNCLTFGYDLLSTKAVLGPNVDNFIVVKLRDKRQKVVGLFNCKKEAQRFIDRLKEKDERKRQAFAFWKRRE